MAITPEASGLANVLQVRIAGRFEFIVMGGNPREKFRVLPGYQMIANPSNRIEKGSYVTISASKKMRVLSATGSKIRGSGDSLESDIWQWKAGGFDIIVEVSGG